MSYEKRADYSERLLFPPSLEDWLGADHPVRFIRETRGCVGVKRAWIQDEEIGRRAAEQCGGPAAESVVVRVPDENAEQPCSGARVPRKHRSDLADGDERT